MTAMKIRHEVTYDAGVDEVYAMLADPDFRQKSLDAMGVVSADVKIDQGGDGMTVIVDQVQRTEGIPSFAKKFAGETTRAVQTEEWPDHTGATLVVTTPGKPSTITGNIHPTVRRVASNTNKVVMTPKTMSQPSAAASTSAGFSMSPRRVSTPSFVSSG